MVWIRRLAHTSPRHLLTVCACLIAALLFAGCGTATARATVTQAPAPTATLIPTATLVPTVTPTLTSSEQCAAMGSGPGATTTLTLPLPPHTITVRLPSAAGAGFFLECTPGATQASITDYLDQAYSQAGWRKWNPQTDNAYGCGTQPNSYWQWSDSQVAVGWDFRGEGLPEWHITVCSLAFGR